MSIKDTKPKVEPKIDAFYISRILAILKESELKLKMIDIKKSFENNTQIAFRDRHEYCNLVFDYDQTHRIGVELGTMLSVMFAYFNL